LKSKNQNINEILFKENQILSDKNLQLNKDISKINQEYEIILNQTKKEYQNLKISFEKTENEKIILSEEIQSKINQLNNA